MDFAQQTVMVTGAAGHLGRAVVDAFRTRNARVVAVDLDHDRLTHAFGQDGERLLLVAADLLKSDEVAHAAQQALQRFGRIDVLCNVAGGFRMGEAVHEAGDDTWDFLLDLNARTLLNAMRAVVPHMLAAGRGHIVNVGAHAAMRGAAGMGPYCAAKSAVIRLTESASAELRERGINVNCVLPTILDTPENRSAMPDADPARWVAPADLAQVIVFLSSSAAKAVHGAALPVTGLS